MPAHERALFADHENARAWRIYQWTVTRFAADLALGGALFARLTEHFDRDDYLDVVERCTVLYDICQPAAKTET